ncbi:WXG100 family type VII secretion target [Blastococcus xanthinilyticus]|uniref:WXG100 family type VII secretion target n=1 Tax=Blastococcus xanthinilyticus TaxID=1564164 RepID=UPI001412B56C|nr:hypothetical protein [Blastococcus xanthinilyticus]
MYGDPAALDALADELRGRAAQVRAAADEHRRSGARARWVSDAAAVYRDRMARDCADVDAVAGRVEEAAELLRRHADEVRERQAAIARAEREVRGWLADQAARGGDLAADVADVVGALPEVGADAWRATAGRLSRLGLW